MKTKLSLQYDPCQYRHRSLNGRTVSSGVTMVEVLAAVVLVTITVTMIASMTIRIQHIWKEISYRRVAMAELNNQLEELTRLPLADIPQAIEKLEASDASATILSDLTLAGEITKDSLGTRITLQINWQRKVPGLPLQLSAWVSDPRTVNEEVPVDE